MWNYEDLSVIATYLEVPVRGKVRLSRITYDGIVTHHVVLSEAIVMPWNGEVKEAGTVVIVDHDCIEEIFGG